jgi:hypothetical protein
MEKGPNQYSDRSDGEYQERVPPSKAPHRVLENQTLEGETPSYRTPPHRTIQPRKVPHRILQRGDADRDEEV